MLVEGDFLGSKVVTQEVTEKNISGDLLVKGPTVFRTYWNKPNATAKEFVSNEWFKTGLLNKFSCSLHLPTLINNLKTRINVLLTGDCVEYADGSYRILGRENVDIIKTGGFKVSSLDVEAKLIEHEDIKDVMVVGVPDLTWGEKVFN